MPAQFIRSFFKQEGIGMAVAFWEQAGVDTAESSGGAGEVWGSHNYANYLTCSFCVGFELCFSRIGPLEWIFQVSRDLLFMRGRVAL